MPLSAAFFACAARQKAEPVDTGEVTAEYDRLDFEDQKVTSTRYVFRFEVKNTTLSAKSFDNVDYSFSFDGKKTVEGGSAPVQVSVEPGGSAFFQVSVPVEYPKDPPGLQALIARRSALYCLEGTLTGPGGNVPVRAEYEVGLTSLPAVTVPGASIARGGGNEVGFTFDLFVNNPNPFMVKIDYLAYGVEIEGVPSGNGKTAEMERIPPNSQLVYTFPAKMDLKVYASQVRQMMTKRTFKWSLTGVLSVEGVELPVKETGTVTFSQ
jgi:LEA14-like dessication related protein